MRFLKYILIILFSFQLSFNIYANNLSVSSVTTTGLNTTDDYILIQFDISWENSFRDAVNWDAAWIFIKYQTSDGLWHHGTLSSTDGNHTAPSGSTIDASSDGMGAFIYRSANGTGTFSNTGVQLRWNYGTDGVADNESVTIKVFAIEMVYVPTGSYQLGDGVSEARLGDQEDLRIPPLRIVDDISRIIGASSDIGGDGTLTLGGLRVHGLDGIDTDQNGSLDNADYPTGFKAFYCMKYEITQEQYIDFLNTLTYDQQAARTANAPSSPAGTGALVSGTPLNNNAIEIMTPGISNTTPAVYGSDFDNDNVFNESNDGQNIACNYLTFADGLSYADWAGLRPMTELEFEKACRGGQTHVDNEYAWGTINLNSTDFTLSSQGSANEGISSGYSISSGNANSTNQTVSGPLRPGIFAANVLNSSRETAGATYYGIMEMSGNLDEKCVSMEHITGRSFTGLHGDGELSAGGEYNVTNWGVTNVMGSRGGSYTNNAARLKVSDRINAFNYSSTREATAGFRGVRTGE